MKTKLLSKLFITLLLGVLSNLPAYAQEGYLDTTFGTNGIVTLAQTVYPHAMCIQQDGKILVAGKIVNDTVTERFICRYHTDGTPDEGFGTNGTVEITQGTSTIRGIAEMPDGQIVVLGVDFDFIRLSNSGELDTGLGENGILTSNLGINLYSKKMKILADGKLLVTGYRYNPSYNGGPRSYRYQAVLAKFNSDLTLDTSFSGGGYYTTQSSGLGSFDVSEDGSIFALGSRSSSDGGQLKLIKILPNGQRDYSFGNSQYYRSIYFGSLNQGVLDMKIIAGGKILFSGYEGSPRNMVLARTLNDGTFDNMYATSGILKLVNTSEYDDIAVASWQLEDGRIVTAMKRVHGEYVDFRLLFTDEDGAIDTTAGKEGFVITPLIAKNLTCAIRQPDGKIIAAGYDDNGLVMVRYTTESTLTSDSFSNGHFSVHPNPATNSITITNLPDTTTITLYNVSGQKLLETTAVAGGSTPIDISNLANGIYFLNTAKGSSKIIKK